MYRQLNGAAYFMSLRQALLAEKKLRILNLLEIGPLLISTEESEIQLTTDIAVLEMDIDWLCSVIRIPDELDIAETDVNIIYYVSGFIGRSVARVKNVTVVKSYSG